MAIDRITRRLIVGQTIFVLLLCGLLLAPDTSQTSESKSDRATPPQRPASNTSLPVQPEVSRRLRPYVPSEYPAERADPAPINPANMHGIDPKRMLLYRPEDLRRERLNDFDHIRDRLRAVPDRPPDRPIRQQ